jgi:flagellar assembly protein FliH
VPVKTSSWSSTFQWRQVVARKIFKAQEVTELKSKVLITPPKPKSRAQDLEVEDEAEDIEEAEPVEVPEEIQPVPVVEEERERILSEAQQIKEDAEQEVERIKNEAEETAFKLMQKSNVDARKAKEDAETEAERIVADARAEAERIAEEAKRKADEILEEAKKNAYGEGREQGFKEGEEEVQRLIGRLHEMLNAASDKRQELLNSTEKQIIDLVLLIAHKVVKVISESEKKVVVENVKQALDKVRGETEITIKVNTQDLALTTRNKKQFIASVESLKGVTVEEDSRIKPGGCIIETSFGDIDARIQTQLDIIEERIRELIPIQG